MIKRILSKKTPLLDFGIFTLVIIISALIIYAVYQPLIVYLWK